MGSDSIYPTSSPAAGDTLKIPFPKRFLFHEVDETDSEASPDGRDRDKSRSKFGKPSGQFDSD
jgi:hypothetical protein